jgi:hypothetical protein
LGQAPNERKITMTPKQLVLNQLEVGKWLFDSFMKDLSDADAAWQPCPDGIHRTGCSPTWPSRGFDDQQAQRPAEAALERCTRTTRAARPARPTTA